MAVRAKRMKEEMKGGNREHVRKKMKYILIDAWQGSISQPLGPVPVMGPNKIVNCFLINIRSHLKAMNTARKKF